MSMFHDSGVLFNADNVLETVKGVEDWWSEGGYYCRGGGLGYWLAVSSEKRGLIQRENADPDVQKRKLIECWREHDFASWHWLSRAVQRVGLTQLASLITTYQHPLTGIIQSTHVYTCIYIYMHAIQNVHVHVCVLAYTCSIMHVIHLCIYIYTHVHVHNILCNIYMCLCDMFCQAKNSQNAVGMRPIFIYHTLGQGYSLRLAC